MNDVSPSNQLEATATGVTLGAAAPKCEATVLTRRVWQHSFGEMLIETKSDGSVWIDGKAVADTLPAPEATQGRP